MEPQKFLITAAKIMHVDVFLGVETFLIQNVIFTSIQCIADTTLFERLYYRAAPIARLN